MIMAQKPSDDVYRVKISDPGERVLAVPTTIVSYAGKALYYKQVVDSALNIGTPDAFVLALKAAIYCDMYDQLNSEGQPEKLFFHQGNQRRLRPQCAQVIDAGLDAYGKAHYQRAIDCFTLYLERNTTSLFTELANGRDPYFSQCAYYAIEAAYKGGDISTAKRYMSDALKDSRYGEDALVMQLSIERDGLSSWQDSLQYHYSLQRAHRLKPKNNAVFGMMVQLYSSEKFAPRLRPFLADEVKMDSHNPQKWAMLGECDMTSGKWEDALRAYGHALVLEPSFVEVHYNAGLCHYSLGHYTQAAECFERCRELDPERQRVQWAQPLYKTYFAMKEEEKARELLPLVK